MKMKGLYNQISTVIGQKFSSTFFFALMKQQFEKIDSNGKWVQKFFKKVNGTKRKMLLFPFSVSLLELDIRFQPIFNSTEEIRLTKNASTFQ